MTFQTNDLYFAAFLKASDIPLHGSKTQGGRTLFLFDVDQEELANLQAGWFTGIAMVAAQPYAEAIKTLKSLCHMSVGTGRGS